MRKRLNQARTQAQAKLDVGSLQQRVPAKAISEPERSNESKTLVQRRSSPSPLNQ
jgi:hypothetical protein